MDGLGRPPKTVQQGMFVRTAKPSEIYLRSAAVHVAAGDYGVKWRSLAAKHSGPGIIIHRAGGARNSGHS
jgi:hypothetical protein